jgi:hypothetical protein
MSLCTTCYEPGIRGEHNCPGIGEITIRRQLGRGLVVQLAPPRARMALALLADAKWGATMASNDQINIADQVLYQVVGYDPEHASLVLELVEDWRKPHVLTFDRKLTNEEIEQFRSEWKRRYGGQGRKVLRHDEEETSA